ncbi:MAG: glycosyltransferase 61 family protein [Pseudomonadota bacterium]
MTDLNDPANAPHPDGGWSTRVRTVPKATIVPITEGYLVHRAGVHDDSGAFVQEAVLWRGRPMLAPGPVPEVAQDLPGRWVWGGVLIGHFGHFLMESTGRLWALDAVRGAIDGLVFVARRDVPAGDLAGFHRDFLDLFCPGVPVRVITETTQVETLEVPGQGFGIGALASGTDIFRDVMHRRFAARIAPRGAERLYISRSELGATLGSVLEEKRIERALAACGYDIFHPQHHTLAEQIARYKAARQIVALDGSALHLFAMVGRKDQQVAMIKRRISNGLNMIIRHLAAFTGRAPLVLDVISRQWVRSDRGGADNFSFAELDFGKLAAALAEAGFIPNGLHWPELTNDEALAAVSRIESQLERKKLRFLPMPRGATAPPKTRSTTVARTADPAFPEDKEAKRARRKARRAKRQAAADKRLPATS